MFEENPSSENEMIVEEYNDYDDVPLRIQIN
jgi:hypothetical protein